MHNIEDTELSTRTIISDVNVELDIESIFSKIPLHVTLPSFPCHIVAMYYKNNTKGDLSVLQNTNGGSFRNAVNIIFRIQEQLLNVKVSRHGNFQITGCKFKANCYQVICYFIQLCQQYTPDVFLEQHGESITIYFSTVMTNRVFDTQFTIDKEKLNRIIQKSDLFYNLYETNFGYTGMNIKLAVPENQIQSKIPVFTWNTSNLKWDRHEISYQSYQNRKQKPKKSKPKFNTFLIFHSGKIIMSGMCEENMKKDYQFFRKFLNDHRSDIEEVIKIL